MRRVAITGMGILSCIGNSIQEVLQSLQRGRSGIEIIPERKSLTKFSMIERALS